MLRKLSFALIIGFLVYNTAVMAQGVYPERPIKLVIGYPPGGAADFVARISAEQISKEIGVPVNVENRPGVGGAIAADLVAKAAPDGYTISMSGPHAQIKALFPKMALDQQIDFIPVGNLASGSMIICVNPNEPYKNLQDLIKFGKANPGVIFNASSGNGSTPHLATALFEGVTQVRFTTIQFKGGSPAAVSTIAGNTQVMFATPPTVMGFIKNGTLRALALTSAKPSAAIPGIPGAEESGLMGYNSTFSYGLYFPAGTPAVIVNKMFAAVTKGMTQAGVKQKLASQGMDLVLSKSPAQFQATLTAEAPALAEVVRLSGAKME